MKTRMFRFPVLGILSSLRFTVIALLVLAILVVWGTFYQIDHGIYAAKDRFFNAWLVFIGGIIPFPALRTIITLLSINLLTAAFHKRPLNIRTIGLIVLHLGVVVLTLGSAVASYFTSEAAVRLSEKQSTSEVYDYTTWQIVIGTRGLKNGVPAPRQQLYHLKKLRNGTRIVLDKSTARLRILKMYHNCSAKLHDRGDRRIVGLRELKPDMENGRNFPGIAFSFDITGEKNAPETLYVYAGMEYPSSFLLGTDTLDISLQPLRIDLPMRIELTRFEVQWHPGTDNAKSFRSRLRLFGKNLDREVSIEMNRPFRYGDITFYQSGYMEQEGGYSSTLAIVKNPLRYLPHVASFIIITGLFLHFFVKMCHEISSIRGKRNAEKTAAA